MCVCVCVRPCVREWPPACAFTARQQSGKMKLSWQVGQSSAQMTTSKTSIPPPATSRSITVTMQVQEEMENPGFIGVGWRKQVMLNAEIWFCQVNDDVFYGTASEEGISTADDDDDKGGNVMCPEEDEDESATATSNKAMFSCCLRRGGNQQLNRCSQDDSDQVYYELEVVTWCLTSTSSSVTIRAPVCDENDDDNDEQQQQPHASRTRRDCFLLSSTADGKMDFIIAYNPLSKVRSHGYQRRTFAQVDLITSGGGLTQSEASVADTGLIATHGTFMLLGWMVLAPWGVFVSCLFCFKCVLLMAACLMVCPSSHP